MYIQQLPDRDFVAYIMQFQKIILYKIPPCGDRGWGEDRGLRLAKGLDVLYLFNLLKVLTKPKS